MDLSLTDFRPLPRRSVAAPRVRAAMSLLALAMCADTAYAVDLLRFTATPIVSPATVPALSCTTNGGPGAAVTVVIKPVTALVSPNTIVVTIGTLPAGVVAVTSPSVQTLTAANQAAGLTYVLNYSPGCAGAAAVSTAATFRPTAGGVADVVVTVNRSVTVATTALAPTPSAVTITCV